MNIPPACEEYHSPSRAQPRRSTRSSPRGGERQERHVERRHRCHADSAVAVGPSSPTRALNGTSPGSNGAHASLRAQAPRSHHRNGTPPLPEPPHHRSAACCPSESCTPTHPRSGLQRRSHVQPSTPERRDGGVFHLHGHHHAVPGRSRGFKHTVATRRRTLIIPLAVVLSLLGYLPLVARFPEAGWGAAGGDWLASLPGGATSTALLGGAGWNGNSEPLSARPPRALRSMEAERKAARSLSRRRAEGRRDRTTPPPALPAAGRAPAYPRLRLGLPAHRGLDGAEEASPVDAGAGNGLRARLLRKGRTPDPAAGARLPCGPQAREAAGRRPADYPAAARLGPRSRVVVTGALSQLGMELILQLHEECHVRFVLGIDAAYPNTRHARLDLVEARYEYLQRRVPGFQHLAVPDFGIHPHPGIGEEARRERSGDGFDLVRRYRPTHVVHFAGMEEGRGEHADYGDVAGASPFEDPERGMMRRFDHLLATDQVFASVAQAGDEQVQLVYVSSDEARDRSGVPPVAGATPASPLPAAPYGTASLLKEVLAAQYHRRHAVASVGLRVPTVFGPFARPGSVLADLAERTVRRAAAGEGGHAPAGWRLRERGRYAPASLWARREGAAAGAEEPVLYVYDAATAIVAAMQFRKDGTGGDPHDGPTLIRLGSQMITSVQDLKGRMEDSLPASQATAAASFLVKAQDPPVAVMENVGFSARDAERARDLLGWTSQVGLQEGTDSMLAWQVLKAFPYGLPESASPSAAFLGLLEDRRDALSLHSLPCAAGCRWGGSLCAGSPWDAALAVTRKITTACPYVIYAVDLRPELANMSKQSAPSTREGREESFCKILFVSISSKLAEKVYARELKGNMPLGEWNGKGKAGHWIVVALRGSQYTMPEHERSLAKLSPTRLFSANVEKAMYFDHRKFILSTDQAMNVLSHMESTPKSADKKTKENSHDNTLSRLQKHSVFFANKISHSSADTGSARKLGRFVMRMGAVAETKDIVKQMDFYHISSHLTRMNNQRSPNYQESLAGNNLFSYDFLRSTWLLHRLRSEEGRRLRCEMYEEHSLWGNAGMEDLSMGYVLAKRKVKMQLGSVAESDLGAPEKWYPLLVPKEPDDDGATTEGPEYLDYTESAQKVAIDGEGHECYVTFLLQKGAKR